MGGRVAKTYQIRNPGLRKSKQTDGKRKGAQPVSSSNEKRQREERREKLKRAKIKTGEATYQSTKKGEAQIRKTAATEQRRTPRHIWQQAGCDRGRCAANQ